MKKYCTITLLFLMVFVLSACSKADTATCSYCSAKIDAMESYCQSCGKPLSSMKPDGYEDAIDEYDTNPFEGVWRDVSDVDDGANIIISFDMTNMHVLEIAPKSKIDNYQRYQYNYTKDELTYITSSKSVVANYTFSNNSSKLTINYDNETFELKRVLDVSYDKSIVGHWTTYTSDVISNKFFDLNGSIKDLFFYKDGSCDFRSEADRSYSGNYQFVHDGKVLRIVYKTYDINILGNDLMIISDSYDDYLLKRVD